MRGLALAVLIVGAVGCKPAASSAVEVRPSVFLQSMEATYPIVASDFPQAHAAVAAKGGLESTLQAGFEGEWTYEVSGCRATSLRVDLKVEHRFPTWDPPSAAATSSWRDLLAGLEGVRKDRDEILAQEFGAFVKQVYGLEKKYECSEFRTTLDRLFEEAQQRALAGWNKSASGESWRPSKKKGAGPEI